VHWQILTKTFIIWDTSQKKKTIPLIRGSDALIQPSIVEGISSTILEAMACKTAIIATNVGGNKEILENNRTGILIKPNSNKELLESILELISNKKKARSLAEESYKEVKHYDWSSVGNQYLKLYKKLLN